MRKVEDGDFKNLPRVSQQEGGGAGTQIQISGCASHSIPPLPVPTTPLPMSALCPSQLSSKATTTWLPSPLAKSGQLEAQEKMGKKERGRGVLAASSCPDPLPYFWQESQPPWSRAAPLSILPPSLWLQVHFGPLVPSGPGVVTALRAC